MAGQTVALPIRFAWTEKFSPIWWPAAGMQLPPVQASTRPWASIIATCRTSRPSSAATSAASASGADSPFRMASRPFGPYAGSTKDWVATAPTPDSAQETMEPTENQ